jgi:2-dehydro-3-deoxyphosphogluconate aldolase / (4S)-4-hydroxy-2-oxoglutarate aldolase
MTKIKFSWQKFSKVPLIGIVRNLTIDEVKQILPVYKESGLTTIEITMNTPDAKEIIGYAVDHYAGKLNIGAGTVCNKADLNEALSAGAQFIVTPITDKKVIRMCVRAAIPIFPGAFTPTEIYRAWKLGASMVKVYPATSMGPDYIKDIKAPLDQIKLLPTGGINLDNIATFMKAGANGLGIGSQLFDKTAIKNNDMAALKAHFKKFCAAFRE